MPWANQAGASAIRGPILGDKGIIHRAANSSHRSSIDKPASIAPIVVIRIYVGQPHYRRRDAWADAGERAKSLLEQHLIHADLLDADDVASRAAGAYRVDTRCAIKLKCR